MKDKDKTTPSSTTVKDSRVSELLKKTGEAMSADENKELIEELKAKEEEENFSLPLVSFLIDGATHRLARAIDKSFLRGDGSLTSSSNAPADYTSVINGVVNLATAVGANGLRVFTGANGASVTSTDLANARIRMGKYGITNPTDLVFMVGVEQFNK